MVGPILIRELIKEGVKHNERRMLVLSGKDNFNLLVKSIGYAMEVYNMLFKRTRLFYFTRSLIEGKESAKRAKEFERRMKEFERLDVEIAAYAESNKYMGRTCEILVLDLMDSLNPNDLGRLIGTVRGGGLVFLLTLKLKDYEKVVLKTQEDLVIPPYTLKDVKHRFERRFVKKLQEHEGIVIVEDKKVRKESKLKAGGVKKKELKFPEKVEFDKELYKLCATQDQINALKMLEKVGEGRVFVITAHRGRGKSALLGLVISGYVKKKGGKVIVTAPNLTNVQTLFEFLEKGLDALGIPYKKFEGTNIISIKGKGFRVEYHTPASALSKKGEVIFVDEAAGIWVPTLFRFLKNFKRCVFSTTIHGYEGAGRGFNVKFMKGLKERGVSVKQYELKEAIRYSNDDPIEKWLFDTLLLDAEPPEIEKVEKKKFVKVDMDEWFEEEEKLRQFVGIYVLAHYQNNPYDLLLIGDAPHHEGYAVLSEGKVICSVQLAKEGGLKGKELKYLLEKEKPKGHLIPDRIAKHYGFLEFAKLRGGRIVRIATHPDLQGKGIGSFALKRLSKLKLDWVGASFGVDPKLLKFWIKNGFVPLHISPQRNEVSGEHSLIVVKPLSKKAEVLVNQINKEFKIYLLYALSDHLRNMDVESALLLLKSGKGVRTKPRLTRVQKEKLKRYMKGDLTYECVVGGMKELTFAYFLSGDYFLEEKVEKVLVAKVLQGRSWPEIEKLTGERFSVWFERMHEIASQLQAFIS